MKDHPERISKIKPFIDHYNWNEIFHPQVKIGKNLSQKINQLLLIFCVWLIILKKMCHAYKSKYNLTRENQVILLLITDGEKWHYLAVKSLSALLRLKTGNNHGDFYCLNCFRAYNTENKFESHKKVCQNHDYCL